MKFYSNFLEHSQSECRQHGALELFIWWSPAASEQIFTLSNIAQVYSSKISVGRGWQVGINTFR